MAADITISPVTVEVLDNTFTDLGISFTFITEPVTVLDSGTSGGGGVGTRPTTGMIYPRGQG